MHGEGELYHYGRLGMKWGQHRFKDRYGGLNNAGKTRVKELSAEHKKLSSINTLTKKGTKKLEDVEKEYEHLTGRPINSQDVAKTAPIKKRIEDMTNEELSAYNNRKQLETTYQGYQPKQQVSKGKKFASYMGSKVITPIATDIGKKWITGYTIAKMNGVQDPAKFASKSLMPKAKDKDKDKAGD